jgi:putative transcriptional regulator
MFDMAIPRFPAEKVKTLRESLEMTQHELANAIGISQALVAHWENGIRQPSGPAAILLAQMQSRVELEEKSLVSA